MSESGDLRLAIVGPCTSGKSELVGRLRQLGYEVRHVAQEHSYAPSMWRQIARPDVLVYLDVDYPTAVRRRPSFSGGPERIDDQHGRLAHARQHCDLYVDTRPLTADQVLERVLDFLSVGGKSAAE